MKIKETDTEVQNDFNKNKNIFRAIATALSQGAF